MDGRRDVDVRTGRSAGDRGSGRAALRAWRDAACAGLAAAVADRGRYDRTRLLPRLIAFDPRELASAGPALDRSIRARLSRALRAERRRGRAGHWTYDLNRHVAVLQALASEHAAADREPAGHEKAPPG